MITDHKCVGEALGGKTGTELKRLRLHDEDHQSKK